MNRRRFLKGLAASAAAVTVAIKTERELHRHIYDRPVVQAEGFGLAPLKQEGSTIGFYGATPVSKPMYLPNTSDNDIGMYRASDDTLKLVVGGRTQLV